MTSKFRLAVALVSSVALLLMTFDSTTRAHPRQRFVTDTGVLTLGPNQILRITVGPKIGDNAGNVIVRFGRTTYTQGPCTTDGVCELTGTNTFTGPVTLMPGEAASCDVLAAGTYGRGVVMSNTRNVQVTASIIDVVTGRVEEVWLNGLFRD